MGIPETPNTTTAGPYILGVLIWLVLCCEAVWTISWDWIDHRVHFHRPLITINTLCGIGSERALPGLVFGKVTAGDLTEDFLHFDYSGWPSPICGVGFRQLTGPVKSGDTFEFLLDLEQHWTIFPIPRQGISWQAFSIGTDFQALSTGFVSAANCGIWERIPL